MSKKKSITKVLLMREPLQLFNRFSLETFAIGSVLTGREVCFDLVFGSPYAKNRVNRPKFDNRKPENEIKTDFFATHQDQSNGNIL
jgi:hypothetical protein